MPLILGLLLGNSYLMMACSNSIKGLPHLPKPDVALNEEQFNRTPVDVLQTFRDRDMQWEAIYQDYLKR